MSLRHPADVVGAAALLALVASYAATFLDFSRHPEEDAAMLLRYSRHLAQGHGVVWNVGEAPVDGATDLLFMALVGLLHRLGLGLESAARGVALGAHAATVLAVYASIRRLFGAPAWLALVPAAYLAAGTGPRYAAALYGTPLFALVAAIAGHAAWRTVQAEPARLERCARALGLLSVLMGIARPEGALLGLLFLAGALLARGSRDARALLAGFATGFVLPGLAYFAWRWWYFGHPLPNPFYRKGGGVLHWDVLERSFRNVLRLGGPFLAVLASGVPWRPTRRLALAALVPVAGFTAMWVLVSDETNYFMRFRYPILPVVLVSWVPVAQAFATRLRPRRPASGRGAMGWWAAGLVGAAALVAWQHRRFEHIEPQRMGLFDVATLLREHAEGGYTIATTEAGLLPLYSEWRAVDAWGLNDAWIAHHGGITEDYLERYRPEVMAFHAYFSPAVPPAEAGARERGLGPAWFDMVMTMQRYAVSRGYTLAAVFGRHPRDTHYYYVRPGFPESEALAARIRGLRYLWNGHPAHDYTPDSPDAGRP
ncbi:MAG TPA: hypothetical protein VMT87_07945 [Vicinamibacteria bacterium]|nr:hypothetical protein [Vicinamibacteria bacterium]